VKTTGRGLAFSVKANIQCVAQPIGTHPPIASLHPPFDRIPSHNPVCSEKPQVAMDAPSTPDAARGAFVPDRGSGLQNRMSYYGRLLREEVSHHQREQANNPGSSGASADPQMGTAMDTPEMLADPRFNDNLGGTHVDIDAFDGRPVPGSIQAVGEEQEGDGLGPPQHRTRRLHLPQHSSAGHVTPQQRVFNHFATPPPHVLPVAAFIFGNMGPARSRSNSTVEPMGVSDFQSVSTVGGAETEGLLADAGALPPGEIVVEGTQGSLVTIFSVWSAMMGSSMLAIPYGFEQSGLAAGLGGVIVTCLVAMYTVSLILKYGRLHGELDFADIAKRYIGRWAQWFALGSSVLVLAGGCIAFITLMSDALFKMGSFAQCWAATGSLDFAANTHKESNVCQDAYKGSDFSDWWTPKYVPLIVTAVVFPLTNVKEVTPLVKLTSFGVGFMSIIVSFILYGSIRAIVQYNGDDSSTPINPADVGKSLPLLEPRFYYLLGICDVAFFIHNAILPMTAQAKNPNNTPRDVGIAFALVGITYSVIGTLSYIAFWNRETPIAQDFIAMFSSADIAALIARLALFLQLIGLYPLLLFVIRIQIFGFILQKQYPSWMHVLGLNVLMAIASTLFAVFYPNIGTLFRFVGALAAFLYVFFLPPVVHMIATRQKGELSKLSIGAHGLIILFGATTLVWQFVPS
jgi:solute carrier family 38 (sodium-coupled neutral amino acid transporter), member 9